VSGKKRLIDIDWHAPLSGFDYAAYVGLPIHGSFALTARGQQVLGCCNSKVQRNRPLPVLSFLAALDDMQEDFTVLRERRLG